MRLSLPGPIALDLFCATARRHRLRVMLVAAHPDDEVIGAAGRLIAIGRGTSLVHITDGAPRNMDDARRAGCRTWQEYAQVRADETSAALRVGGIALARRIELGVPDQESFGWMSPIARCIARLIATERPHLVVTHAYEGGHPDHDTSAFAVQMACELMSPRQAVPVRLELASYHTDRGAMRVGEFLTDSASLVRTIELTHAEQQRKRLMLDAFVTQRDTLRPFGTTHEAFRLAPHYDFMQPPHAGLLHYEYYRWGTRGTTWRAHATAALVALGCH